MSNRKMIDRWAEYLPQRRLLTAFWDWLSDHLAPTTQLREVRFTRLIDTFAESEQLDVETRRKLDDFARWLQQKLPETHGLYNIHLENTLNSYHEIDAQQLESERRALLESMRS